MSSILDDYSDKCPNCDSENVSIGNFVLDCHDCGWSHLNKHPCTVCGEPSTSFCGLNNHVWYGCKTHSATKQMFKLLEADV